MIEQFCILYIENHIRRKENKLFCDNCRCVNIFKIQMEMRCMAETNADNCR